MTIKNEVSQYLAEIGAKGGRKSKRKLTRAQAVAMVKAREAWRKSDKALRVSTQVTSRKHKPNVTPQD